jgi:uncharacterized 2Fe-2S/4Fe-4S cluster protein (DUF4445 family)
MTDTAYVVFTPSGKRGRFAVGTAVLDCARRLGVDVDSVCGGRGICGRCQITVAEGNFAKHGIASSPASVEPLSEPERLYGKRKGLAPGRRLGCHARLLADAVIDVPPESQVHRQVVRKRAEARAIVVDPVVKPYYLEVAKPDLHHPSGDYQRLDAALKRDWGITLHDTDLHVLRNLQRVLREGDWKVTAAVRHTLGRYDEVVGLWPGFKDRFYGLAVDIGSTTVACHLCDLSSGEVLAAAGAMNPQIRFGEDLMSRISYIMDKPDAVEEMSAAVRRTLNGLVGETAAEAGIDPRDIIEVVLVGNPIMHHLILGVNPTELGVAPFALCTDGAVKIYAEEDLHLDIALGARAYFLPCIAGHVGADAAAVILSESPHHEDETVLIVDVGTNAEIVLGNRTRLLAASSPTGPAFEGAEISCGQRAAPGSRSSAATSGPARTDSPRRPRRPGSPGSAARASSRRWARCSWPVSCAPTAPSTADSRRARPGYSPTARPSHIWSTTAIRRCASPRTTSAPSSSPRARFMPARGCSWTTSASTASGASCSPAPSAVISTSSTPCSWE